MKLCFSTLGCPRWTFKDILSTAKDLNLDGIEIRGVEDQMYAPAIDVFSAAEIEKTKQRLREAGLEIPVFTSGAALAEPQKAQEAFLEACAYIDLAAAFGSPYIRVMGTGEPQIALGDFGLAAGLYRQLCVYGQRKGVTPLIETNGMLSASGSMRAFLEDAGHANSGVLWDVHHTLRYGGEMPLQTVAALGDQIRHVHVKDSTVVQNQTRYQMMGYGDIPLEDALCLLGTIGYEGFVSLEWVKRWNPDLQEPGIVFAHFKSYMDGLLS